MYGKKTTDRKSPSSLLPGLGITKNTKKSQTDKQTQEQTILTY